MENTINSRKFTHYKSSITENLFSRDEFINHGYGGVNKGFKDLPQNEYLYKLIIVEQSKSPYEKL